LRQVSARIGCRAVVAGELVAAVAALGLSTCLDWRAALAVGAGLGLLICVLTVGGLTLWQWAWRVIAWARRRDHVPALIEAFDVTVDGRDVGVVVDGETVCTMISLWGKPYVPTLLHAQRAETPNTVPVTVIAEQMCRYGLAVDVDMICEGRRTAARDNYADLYETFLRGLPAAGQRSVALLVRLHARSVVGGLVWRRDTINAAVAASQRIARALCQKDCRAKLLTAEQMSGAVAASLGGPEHAKACYRDGWTHLRRGGKAYVTSYFLSDLRAQSIDNVWCYPADHTTVVVALRNSGQGVRASAMVRYTTPQPIPSPPALGLNSFTGRQWDAVALTLPGRARLGLPSAPVSIDLDTAIVAGPSGVLLGKRRDAMVLMPIWDPAGTTRIGLRADDKTVRQLIRRAAAAGEQVAVYDPDRCWAMTAGSPRIWATHDMTARPPRPPTMVIHNGVSNDYPDARTAVTVGEMAAGAAPDIRIEQDGDRIIMKTQRFGTALTAVSFRNEETYLQ